MSTSNDTKKTQRKEAKKAAVEAQLKKEERRVGRLRKATKEARDSNNFERVTARKAHGPKSLSGMVQLLGTKETQEISWLETVVNPEAFAARIPITQVTGAVPVDLYRKTLFFYPQANANGEAYIMAMPDGWHTIAASSQSTYLRTAADPASTGTTFTFSTYAGIGFPAPVVVLPTGASAVAEEVISPEFTSNAADGTEYIMVANQLSMAVSNLPAATADQRWAGRVFVVRTLDPERYPIAGQNIGTLMDWAHEQDAQVVIAEYLIEGDGSFRPIAADPSRSQTVTELTVTSLPLSKDAYKWQRIGETVPYPATHTVAAPDIGIFIRAPASCIFQARVTHLYQTERYPNNRVVAPMSSGSISSVHGARPGYTWDPSGFGGDGGWRKNPGRLLQQQLMSANVGPAPSMVTRHVVPAGSPSGTTPIPVHEPAPVTRAKRATREPETVPLGSLSKAAPHLHKVMGMPVHPGLAPLAVVADQAESPGFWNQLASQGAAAIKDHLCNPKLAKLAVENGPAAVDAASADSGFSWTGMLSGLWDVIKTVGPAVLGMLV